MKNSGKIFVILIILMAVYFIIIRIDSKPDAKNFKKRDIPDTAFNKNNGFYVLWALNEPSEIDVDTDEIREKYGRLFDKRKDYLAYQKKMNWNGPKTYYASTIKKKIDRIDLRFQHDISKQDWCEEVLKKATDLSPLDADIAVLLKRNRLMMEKPDFEDFIQPEAMSPIPNLLAWLHACKLYTGVHMLRAMKGQWLDGTAKILDQLDFSKRAIKGSRALINNLVAKAVMHVSLQGIASLMNQKECPQDVFKLVLRRMPPLKYQEYGSGRAMTWELMAFCYDYIEKSYNDDKSFWEKILITLLLKKNHIRNYANRYYQKYIHKEQTLPYLWENGSENLIYSKRNLFWWLSNPGGKYLFSEYTNYSGDGGLFAVIFKSYRKKALYEMVKIAAELHLKYTADQPIPFILNHLNTYQKLKDPCSGKPYLWNGKKQLLYSLGTDRQDNGGETNNYQKIDGSDYALPIILYVR